MSQGQRSRMYAAREAAIRLLLTENQSTDVKLVAVLALELTNDTFAERANDLDMLRDIDLFVERPPRGKSHQMQGVAAQVCNAIVDYLRAIGGVFCGTPNQLLVGINGQTKDPAPGWPDSPRGMAGRLADAREQLSKLGIVFDSRRTNKGRTFFLALPDTTQEQRDAAKAKAVNE